MLSARRGAVLRIIVGDYIEKAIPVGSEHIAKSHSLGVSPATIRNDMAVLEEEGYITHPHISAGRVPSDKGYRYFVEGLMEQEELSLADQQFILRELRQWGGELEDWSRLAAEILARLAQTMAVSTIPRAPATRFKHLELVALQEFLVLLVLVLREMKVKQQLLRLEEAISQDELSTLAHRMSASLQGLSAQQIAELALPAPAFEGQALRTVVRLMESEDAPSVDMLHLEGLRHLLDQPEFSSSERLRSLMDLVEGRHVLGALLPRLAQNTGVRVVIGSENPAEEMREFSIVIAQYGRAGGLSGTIGLLGPTRMRYPRAISTVRFLADMMTEFVGQRYA